jgi:hypothetical protein
MTRTAVMLGLTLALASCTTPTPAVAPQQDVARMIVSWNALNSACRGGSGDKPETLVACDKREILYAQIKAKGMCYGEHATAGYLAEWNACARIQ